MSNTWLPVWLESLLVLGFVVVLLLHVRHAITMEGWSGLWHGVHVLMAIGMIDMAWPESSPPVGSTAGEVVFGLAAVALLVVATLPATRRRGVPWLWLVGVVDLAAMAYMFAMMSHRYLGLTLILTAWFVLETVAWAGGLLATLAQRRSLVPDAEVVVAIVSDGNSDETDPQAKDAAIGAQGLRGPTTATLPAPTTVLLLRRTKAWSIRVSLSAMSLAMAYMLLAMQFGMQMATTVKPGGNMPGMPGM